MRWAQGIWQWNRFFEGSFSPRIFDYLRLRFLVNIRRALLGPFRRLKSSVIRMSSHLFPPKSSGSRVPSQFIIGHTANTTTSSRFDTRVCSAWLRRSKTAVKWIKRRADKRRLEEVEVRAHSENWTKSSVEKKGVFFLDRLGLNGWTL